MKILITGATGFVGKHLIPVLVEQFHSIAILVRDTKKAQHLSNSIHRIDLNSDDWQKQVTAFNAETVIHLASYLTSSDDEQAIGQLLESNINFGTRLLDALRGTSVKFFINTGTFAEYKHQELLPTYLYAATKTAFRSILKYYQQRLHFKVINVIPYTIYGGQDTQRKLIDIIYQSASASTPVSMSPGNQVLDFIHMNDVINFYLHLLSNTDKIELDYYDVHLGTSIGTSPREISNYMNNSGIQTQINWGGIPYRPTDTMHSVAPHSDLLHLLGWQAKINIREGINLYLKAIKEQ